MSGIIFNKTKKLSEIVTFYKEKLNMEIWDDQTKCKILSKGNLLLGFCESDFSETEGMITFFYEDKQMVDKMYKNFKDIATCEPRENEEFNIYQFFAKDPEGRNLEFQAFLYDLAPYKRGDEILRKRRSYRRFKKKEVKDTVLKKILKDCRYSPTSMNSESYYFVIVKNRKKIEKLAAIRGNSSKPIKEAPVAVAVCASGEKTKRPKQDGDIAAYHFMLSAFNYGLGTCWIADMNRKKVKKILDIPENDFVATVTPLGYPDKYKNKPDRRKIEEFFIVQK